MKHLSMALPLFLLLAACDTGGPSDLPRPVFGDGGVDLTDTDGDGITDRDEGRALRRDTDGDRLLDYQDLDSDGDGIADALEAGDGDPATPPRDTDGDSLPDFIDLDSDDNGIPDAIEGTEDTDSDGLPNFADLDDDDDFIPDGRELAGQLDPPVDSDGDGLPDFRDPDSDNDLILDGHERDADTDGDGLFDFADTDSDNDGILDSVEAGDLDLRTVPVDTDGDGIPDFRDTDSDGDGLSDATELAAGSSPVLVDTDGDLVSDLIEYAAGTDPVDPLDNPQAHGNFFFQVPYLELPAPGRDTLSFRTSLQFADLYFGFDTTGSMGAELTAMRSATAGVPAIISMLRCTETTTACRIDSDCGAGDVCNARGLCAEDPLVASCLSDIWTGVGTFSELDTFRNIVSLQSDPARTASSVPRTGGGASEAPLQAPACVADGTNCTNTTRNCATTGVGCPGFRLDAVRIYIQITDADDQCRGARCTMFNAAYAGSELNRQNIKFIGLYGTGDQGGRGTARSVAEDIGRASGTVDSMGGTYTYLAIDAAVVSQTVTAVRDLVNADNFRVTIDAVDQPGDSGDALQFIDHLEVNATGAGCSARTAEDTDMDGFLDTFPSLRPGTPVCWDIVVKENITVVPTAEPQVFRAVLTVRADGSSVDSRAVYFLVPPVVPDVVGPL